MDRYKSKAMFPSEDDKVKEELTPKTKVEQQEDEFDLDDDGVVDIPEPLNQSLNDLVDDNPNKLMGCGG